MTFPRLFFGGGFRPPALDKAQRVTLGLPLKLAAFGPNDVEGEAF